MTAKGRLLVLTSRLARSQSSVSRTRITFLALSISVQWFTTRLLLLLKFLVRAKDLGRNERLSRHHRHNNGRGSRSRREKLRFLIGQLRSKFLDQFIGKGEFGSRFGFVRRTDLSAIHPIKLPGFDRIKLGNKDTIDEHLGLVFIGHHIGEVNVHKDWVLRLLEIR